MIVYDDGVTAKRPVVFMQPDWKGVCPDTVGQARAVAGKDYVVLMADMFGSGYGQKPKTVDDLRAGMLAVHKNLPFTIACGGAAYDALLGEANKLGLVAVSYTHLDVYKRQEQLHVIFKDKLLRLGHRGIGLALAVLDDQIDLGAGEVAADFVEIHLKAVGHVGADLGERTGHRRDQADAQFFLRGRGRKSRRKREAGTCLLYTSRCV